MSSTYFLWGNKFKVPSDEFVKEYLDLTGIYLARSVMFDKFMTAMTQKYSLNIFTLEKVLINEHGYDDNANESMSQFMMRKWGDKGPRINQMTNQLINGDFPYAEA